MIEIKDNDYIHGNALIIVRVVLEKRNTNFISILVYIHSLSYYCRYLYRYKQELSHEIRQN